MKKTLMLGVLLLSSLLFFIFLMNNKPKDWRDCVP